MTTSRRPSRRQFPKRTAGAAAPAALGGLPGHARAVHAAGSDQLRVALIGCGGRGTGAAANCLNVPDNVKLVALADAFADQARAAAERLKKQYPEKVDVPPERVFAGFDAYEQAISAGVDLVEAIRKDTPRNEGWYGADSSFTAVLGRMATYSGKVVRWDEAVAKGPDEMPARLAWDADPPLLPGPDGGYEHAVAVPGEYRAY